MHGGPLGKPNKDARLCRSERPISLIRLAAKFLDAVALRLFKPLLGKTLDACHFAYRRERGTEFCLPPLRDCVCGGSAREWCVLLAAVDIGGAFDSVPRVGLVETLIGLRVDSSLVRCAARRPQGRRTPFGICLSLWCPISRGFLEDGGSSPFRSLLHITPFQT